MQGKTVGIYVAQRKDHVPCVAQKACAVERVGLAMAVTVKLGETVVMRVS